MYRLKIAIFIAFLPLTINAKTIAQVSADCEWDSKYSNDIYTCVEDNLIKPQAAEISNQVSLLKSAFDADTFAALVKSQNAWEKYRDEACNFMSLSDFGVGDYESKSLGCKNDFNVFRISQLKKYSK